MVDVWGIRIVARSYQIHADGHESTETDRGLNGFPSRGSRVRIPFPAPSLALDLQGLARDSVSSLNAGSSPFCYSLPSDRAREGDSAGTFAGPGEPADRGCGTIKANGIAEDPTQ